MRLFSLACFGLALFSFGCSEPLPPVLDAGHPVPDAGGDGGASDAGGPDTRADDDAGAPDASIALPPSDPDLEACWPGRFCWLEGADATWIDGADDASVHVVDRSGRVFRREPSGWAELPGIAERRVSRIYVVGRDDVWALATHRDEEGFFVDHFDGSTWSSSWPAADGTYLAGYGAEVWTREAGTHAFIRHDTDGWHSVPEIDARFAALATHRHLNAYAEPAILPGPNGSAYAITADAVPLVIHLPVRDRPWDPIWQLVGPLAPGEAWLSWSEGEVRVVELAGAPTELRFDGRRWTPVRVAGEDEYFVATRDGIVIRPTSTFCLLGLTTRTSTHCAGDGRSTTRAIDGSDPLLSLLPEATRPFSPALFDQVAPTYWAGAHAVVGEGAASYVRLPREEAFFGGARWLEQVNDGAPSAITIDGSPLAARLIAGNADGELYAVDHRWLHGVRTREGVALAPVTMASGSPFVAEVTAMRATDEGAWAVTGNQILWVQEGQVTVDAELPTTGFEDAIDLVDVHVSGQDVWLLGALGHRTRYAVLFHREVNERDEPSYRRIELGFSFWGRAHLERAGERLVVAANRNGPPELFFFPIDELEGPTLPQPLEAYLRSGPVRPGTYAPRFETAGLWADARGAWLTSDAQTLFFPLE